MTAVGFTIICPSRGRDGSGPPGSDPSLREKRELCSCLYAEDQIKRLRKQIQGWSVRKKRTPCVSPRCVARSREYREVEKVLQHGKRRRKYGTFSTKSCRFP